VVILGDNIFEDDISPFVRAFEAQGKGARVLLKEVSDPQRFGVARFEDGRITGIIEKPKDPPSNLAVTGIYMYDHTVYDLIPNLKPSKRGELEITDVNNEYLRQGTLEYDTFQGWWTDAGTFPSLFRANALLRKDRPDDED
jgi:glucose-1-phosphate thymidylyltransferase